MDSSGLQKKLSPMIFPKSLYSVKMKNQQINKWIDK